MKKNRISKNWINKQKRDIYVRQSLVDGYRARSAYKLIEIDDKFKIMRNLKKQTTVRQITNSNRQKKSQSNNGEEKD